MQASRPTSASSSGPQRRVWCVLWLAVILAGPVLAIDSAPEHIHLTLLPAEDELLVGWVTTSGVGGRENGSGDASTVRFGLSPGALTIEASSPLPPMPLDHGTGHLHEVRLSGLHANGISYYYRCGSDSGGWSEELSFRLTRSHGSTRTPRLMFLTHEDVSRGAGVTISEAAGMQEAEALIHMGDIPYKSEQQSTWESYGQFMEPLLARMPSVYVTAASIEHTGNLTSERVERRIAEKDGLSTLTRKYWSFNYGAIHFVIASSEERDPQALREQLKWMSSDLAIASRVEERQLRPWIVVLMHRSMLSQEEGNVPGAAWGEVFLEVMDIHRVDLILAGGCHGYKRVMPGGSMSAKTYFSGGVYDGEVPHLGPIQITTGGDTHICQQEMSNDREPVVHGFGMLEADRWQLVWTMTSNQGTIQDQFRICSRVNCAQVPSFPIGGAVLRQGREADQESTGALGGSPPISTSHRRDLENSTTRDQSSGGHSHADAPDKGTMMALITVVGVLGFLVAVLLILVVLLHTRRYCDAIDAVAKSDILRRYEMQSEGHPQSTPHPRDSAPGGMIELGSSKSIHAVLAAFGRPHGLSARHRSGHRHGHKRSRSMGHMSPVPEGCEDPSPAGSPLKLPEVGASPEEEQDPKQAGEEATEKAHGDHQWQLRQLAGKAGLGRQKNAQRVAKYSPLASQSGSGEYALACVEAMSTSDPDIDVPIAVTTEGNYDNLLYDVVMVASPGEQPQVTRTPQVKQTEAEETDHPQAGDFPDAKG